MGMGAGSSGCQRDWPPLTGGCTISPELLSTFLCAASPSRFERAHVK